MKTPLLSTADVDGAPPGPERSQPGLLVVGNSHFEIYSLATGVEISLGRDPACTITLDHPEISQRHAVVRRRSTGTGAVVQDLGGGGGVLIGKDRLGLGQSADLQLGDSFRLGPFTIVVMADQSTNAPSPALSTIAVTDPRPTGVPPAVTRFARSSVNVLIRGETGTGKEVLARTIHDLSARPGPFVGINVAAISESLLESELFGYERGAFTGANQSKPGLLETAPGGTVFLDEIGDLPASLQAKLLRAIETRQVYRVGGIKPIHLDVRFLAATHRDLRSQVSDKTFRSDLYYRLNGITLELVPLRDRRSAILRLANTFLAEAAAALARPAPRLSFDAVAQLSRHDWPGNVRELRIVIERAIHLCDGDEIGAAAILIDASEPPSEPDSFAAVAYRYRGNISAIARELGTSRSQVHRLAHRFGVHLEALRTG